MWGVIGKSFYLDSLLADIPPIPASTNCPITKAEQTKPDSRAARRQAKREKNRKWEIEYRESEGRT